MTAASFERSAKVRISPNTASTSASIASTKDKKPYMPVAIMFIIANTSPWLKSDVVSTSGATTTHKNAIMKEITSRGRTTMKAMTAKTRRATRVGPESVERTAIHSAVLSSFFFFFFFFFFLGKEWTGV
eukprot:TRINITY_DN525_c0_g1_i5.p2 TRINITY_DN525_c0_g1~~TRINITY_DN525_c0_g1_i5.p2  ORF type:complete len:129 (-),score=38.75 TRINITY_DN525_c0_g1_i5:397-783(-)